MDSKYEIPRYKILPEKTISKIHDSSISILEKIEC
jgi:trimethylamine:corrinoid methyltransferase-like protein